uniref:Kinesin motor domain-containing protein n=1 Tax=Haemonchus placei TaxID=6290 RepID=A0A0N4W8R5_HAEPC
LDASKEFPIESKEQIASFFGAVRVVQKIFTEPSHRGAVTSVFIF